MNVDGIDCGGAPALPVRVEASVDAVLRVALLNFLRGISKYLSPQNNVTESSNIGN